MSPTLTTTHRSKTLPSSLDTLPVISPYSYSSSTPSTFKGTSHLRSSRPQQHVTIPATTRPSGMRRMTAVAGDNSLGLSVADDYVDAASTRRAVTLSPLTSPGRDLREDPFSLGNFFPSWPGSPPVEPPSWLSPTEEEAQEEEEEERKAEMSVAAAGRSYSLTALDNYAKEVIAKEDRLGILSLIRIPSFFKGIISTVYVEEEDEEEEDGDDVPITPTSLTLDEPHDDETLYETLCSRRAAASARLGTVPLPNPEEAAGSLGAFSLFSPTAESNEGQLGWTDALYSRVLAEQ